MTTYIDVLDKDGNVIGYQADGSDYAMPDRVGLTRYEFRSRFTTAEKVAMYDSTDTIVRIFMDDIQAAEYIDVTNQETIDGVAYLEAQGLIAAGRSTDILAGIPQ